MNHLKKLSLLACGLLASGLAQAGYTPTVNDWLCTNKVGGSFTAGRVASGCDVDAFGPPSFVRGNYGPVIFNDAVYTVPATGIPVERARYMQQMYPVIRDAAERYLKSRQPDVSASELQDFQRGVFSLLRQESVWSHYRDAQLSAGQPYLLKMLRGDSGHGHGMMQVDDRYHLVPLQEGKGWNMLQNFSYAIDIYYAGWQKAALSPRTSTQGCLAGRTDNAADPNYSRDRARSAWSAYNGGPTKLCRWMNDAVPADPNATTKDPQYLSKWDTQAWIAEVGAGNLTAAAAIDVPCLLDNGSACPLPASGPPQPNTLMKLGSSACVLVNGALECVDDLRDAACLGSRTSFDDSVATTIYAAAVSGLARTDHNRHQLCRAGVTGLQALGSAINTNTALELRSSVGGMLVGNLPAGNYQVLDFEVRGVLSQQRYYRLRGADMTSGAPLDGWIMAGDRNSFATVTANAAPAGASAITYPGDWVTVNTSSNLNFRATPGGTLLTSMPRGTLLQVKEVFGTNSANNLYYRAEFAGKDGWFFAGNLYPVSTLANWVIPSAAPALPTKPAHCPLGSRYDIQARACLSSSSYYGPFTASATQQCLNKGYGAVCTAGRGVVVDGATMALQIWSKAIGVAANGNGDCPAGAARSTLHRFHCTEAVTRNNVVETDVYGPFGTEMVNACLAANGNATFCRSNRWPAVEFTRQQP